MFRMVFPSIVRTVHTATGVCQTDTVDCLLAGQEDRPKHGVCYSNKINLRHWCIWLVLLLKYPLYFQIYLWTSTQYAHIPMNWTVFHHRH